MIRVTCLYSLAMIVSFPLLAMADVAPPPPGKGFKRVPFEHVMKLDKEIPGYRFYPFRRLGINGELTLGKELKLTKKTGVPVPSNSSASVRTGVVAVPDKVMEKLTKKENLAKLLTRENKDKLPAGVVVHDTFGTIRDLKESDSRTKVVNVITVSPDKKAGVKFAEKVTPEPPGEAAAPQTSSQQPPYATLIAGIAATLAIIALGIVYFRRSGSGNVA